jgi:hypothetical protein
MNNEGIPGYKLKQFGFQEGWQVTCRGPDAWGYLDYDQLPFFAYREQFGVEAGGPLYLFSPAVLYRWGRATVRCPAFLWAQIANPACVLWLDDKYRSGVPSQNTLGAHACRTA